MKEVELKITLNSPIKDKVKDDRGKVIKSSDKIQLFLEVQDESGRRLDWDDSFLRQRKLLAKKGKSITVEVERGGEVDIDIVIKAPDNAPFQEYKAVIEKYWEEMKHAKKLGKIGTQDSRGRRYDNPTVLEFTLEVHAKGAKKDIATDRNFKNKLKETLKELAEIHSPNQFRSGSWKQKYEYVNSLITDNTKYNKLDKLFTGKASVYGMLQKLLTESNVFTPEQKQQIQANNSHWKQSLEQVTQCIDAGGKLKARLKQQILNSIMALNQPNARVDFSELGKKMQFYFEVNKSGKIKKVNDHMFSETHGFKDPNVLMGLYQETYRELGAYVMEYLKQSSQIVQLLEQNILTKEKEVHVGKPEGAGEEPQARAA